MRPIVRPFSVSIQINMHHLVAIHGNATNVIINDDDTTEITDHR